MCHNDPDDYRAVASFGKKLRSETAVTDKCLGERHSIGPNPPGKAEKFYSAVYYQRVHTVLSVYEPVYNKVRCLRKTCLIINPTEIMSKGLAAVAPK